MSPKSRSRLVGRAIKKTIYEILNNFMGVEPLKELFWTELNYDRVNESLSRRGWPKTATEVLAEDPVLFASGGQGDEFHIIYSRLSSDRFFITHERPVVSKLLNDHPFPVIKTKMCLFKMSYSIN
jgi:hypothetical protein